MAATIKNPVSTSSSSTSSFTNEWTYDVFISFRGIDTRFGFAGYLYNALSSKGMKTFFDDEELQKGAEITPNLVKAIQQSRIAIVVFSENYASSRFCLDELATIMERSKDKGTLVLPVFYKVDPSNVRHLIGSYREAFDKHEERFKNEKDKIERWRLALKRAADLSGSHFRTDTYRYEYEFVGDIVQEVSKRINRTLLHVADYPIRVKYRVQEVNLLLDFESNKGVGMVGIYGIEGIGKTTLARAVYNSIADQFESLCFLADIRESLTKHGLEQLQERLLYESIGEKDIKLWNVNKGIPIIKSRLSSRKVLLILDDIDKSEQLKALAGELDWFGPGSRIIVTTRNQDLLRRFGIARTYEVESLSYKEARELFSWHAFKKKELLNPDFLNILDRVLRYCKGRPRYLETISSDLFGKTVWECFSTLRNLEIPSYKPERDETICKSKEKEEAHVHKYVTIVIIEADMYEYEDVRFTGLYEGFMNRSFRIQEQTPFILLKEHLAEEFGIPVIYQRLWLSIPTGQQSRYIPLTPEQETQPVEKFTTLGRAILFLEWETGQDFRPIPLFDRTKDDLMLFFFYYHPSLGNFRYVGRLYVKASSKPMDIMPRLNEMAGFAVDEELEYFDLGYQCPRYCKRVEKNSTFHVCQFLDGNIIYFEKALKDGSNKEFQYPDILSYRGYLNALDEPAKLVGRIDRLLKKLF